jgi:hypothetical protein
LTGLIFELFGDFYPFWAILEIFGAHFSPFCRFSGSETRYTRTQESRLYYRSSQNRFEAGRPSATAVQNPGFGNTNLHTFYTILHSTICTRALLKSLGGGSFWDHFFDIGCGRTSCFNLCLGWAIVQGAIRRASIPYLGFENVSQAGKSAPKKWSKLTRTGENRPKMEKVAPANKGFRSQLPRLPHASTPHAGPL